MPPKGVICPPARLGSVARNHGGHRLALRRMIDIGVQSNTYGPTRSTKAAAEDDLARARKCRSRRDMLEFVRRLSGSRKRALPGAAGAARPAAAEAAKGKLCSGCAQSVEGAEQALGAAPSQAPLPAKAEAPARPLVRRRMTGKASPQSHSVAPPTGHARRAAAPRGDAAAIVAAGADAGVETASGSTFSDDEGLHRKLNISFCLGRPSYDLRGVRFGPVVAVVAEEVVAVAFV